MKTEQTLKAQLKDELMELRILEGRKARAKANVESCTGQLLNCHGHVPLDENQSVRLTNDLVRALRAQEAAKDVAKTQKKTVERIENELHEMLGGPLDAWSS